jgi:hypothetical protein
VPEQVKFKKVQKIGKVWGKENLPERDKFLKKDFWGGFSCRLRFLKKSLLLSFGNLKGRLFQS